MSKPHRVIPIVKQAASAPKPRVRYDCLKCPGYCCSYDLIEVGKRDVARLARHFEISYQQAEDRFTKYGVVTPAQALMVIAPKDYSAEVEATLENKDVGFVKVGQKVEVKVETFPFTKYGTLTGTVSFVSNDAVNDEKKGLIFQARIKLDKAVLKVDEREVKMTPGMAVSAEIATGTRRLITYFLDPLRKTTGESLRER